MLQTVIDRPDTVPSPAWTRLTRGIFRNVAEAVLAMSPVQAVLAWPDAHQASNPRTLLVCMDGSPGGLLALGAAGRVARRTGARPVLLRVVTTILPLLASPVAGHHPAPIREPRPDPAEPW